MTDETVQLETTQPATRVVLAEDSVLLRDGIVRLLTSAGFDVAAACPDADSFIEAVDERLVRHGVRVVSPREDATRGGHVTIAHEDFREVYRALWDDDVVPDFREPDGIRLGLSPLSTSYGEVAEALLRIETALTR